MGDLLAFIDVESDGLFGPNELAPDHFVPSILEVAMVVTDYSLTELSRCNLLVWDGNMHQGSVARQTEIEALRNQVHSSCRDLHDTSGLWQDLMTKHTITTVDADFILARTLKRLRMEHNAEKIWMAGSGVAAYDRRLFTTRMPRSSGEMTYQSVDATQVGRFLTVVAGVKPFPPEDIPHRAEGDVDLSIRLFKQYRDLVLGYTLTSMRQGE